MLREIIIDADPLELRIAILENKELINFFTEREKSIVGNIYKGKIVNILSGLHSAFVNIGIGKEGFLPLDNKEEFLDLVELSGEEIEKIKQERIITNQEGFKKGQEILVQVSKEAIDLKRPRLTRYIALPGKYLVLLPGVEHIGISQKIVDKEERKRLKELIQKILYGNMGVVIRTAGENKSQEVFSKELDMLVVNWLKIKSMAESKKSPACIYQDNRLLYNLVRDFFTDEVKKIVVNSEEYYNEILKLSELFVPHLRSRVMLYEQKTPIFETYNVELALKQAVSSKVELESGGYIVIEQTEALTAIDVNSGRFNTKNREETAFKTNLEAAVKIAKQIKLRDIGGIIAIDFIDMIVEKHKAEVLKKLTEEFQKDKAKLNIAPFTEFGVVELTRERTKASLVKSLCQICPYCAGRGNILSEETIYINLLKKLTQIGVNNKEKKIIINVHPAIARRLKEGKEESNRFKELLKKYDLKVRIDENKDCHLEKYFFLSFNTLREIK